MNYWVRIMQSAKEMTQLDFDPKSFADLASRVRISETNVEVLKRIANRHGDGMQDASDQGDIRRVYRKFRSVCTNRHKKSTTAFDTIRETRRLAWALTYSENRFPRIVDSKHLHAALEIIEDRFSVSALLGVFDALLQTWDTRNAGLLRTFIKKHLRTYDGRRKFVKRLKDNIAWYCEANSATRLAMNISRTNVKLSEIWSFLELPEHICHYRFFGAVGEAYVSINLNSAKIRRRCVGS